MPKKLADLLFRSFEAKEAFLNQVSELRLQHPDRPIAFALLGGGFLEFWAMKTFLNDKFGKSWELNLGTRISSLWIESAQTIIRRVASWFWLPTKARSRVRLCADELLAGRPIVLNFEYTDRRRAFEVPAGEKELGYLAHRVPNLLLVPVVFVWRRKRLGIANSEDLSARILKGLLAPLKFPKDVLLGDPAHPTHLRKLAILLRQYERSTLRLTDPIEIHSLNVKVLRRKILTSILQEKKVVLGPALQTPKFIGENILRSPSFARVVRAVAAEQEVKEITLYKKSEKYFNEISANFSYFTIEMFGWFLSVIFTRVFDRLTTNDEEFDKLRLVAREGPLLLIPSHKSYFDFLILSYVFFCKDIAPPHIAAGINLRFWPFGPIARSSGAFFIRRSFRGNVLYIEVLRRYIAALLQSKHNVEFFIEGARSRNGKLAPPKFGMLKMVTDSYIEGLIQEKVRIVPVSINYDRVTEVRSHKRELEGGEKVQESFFNLFKSVKILFKRFGEVNVRLAEPIAMEDWIDQSSGSTHTSLDTRKLEVQKLAFEICHRINKTTPVPGTGIVCSILLAKPGAALPKAEFDAWLARVFIDLKKMNVILNPNLSPDFMRGCHRAVAGLMEDGIIEKYQTSTGKVGLRIPQKQRIAALYYKNSAVHALLTAGIAGLAQGSVEELLEIRSLFQFEFFFPEKEIYVQTFLKAPENVMTDFYSLIFDDTFENIQLGIQTLIESQEGAFETKEWRNRFMKYGKTGILESEIKRLEAVNTQSFMAFIEMAKNKKWLLRTEKEGLFRAAPASELRKQLDRIQFFRGRLPAWESLRAKYLREVPHESEATVDLLT